MKERNIDEYLMEIGREPLLGRRGACAFKGCAGKGTRLRRNEAVGKELCPFCG